MRTEVSQKALSNILALFFSFLYFFCCFCRICAGVISLFWARTLDANVPLIDTGLPFFACSGFEPGVH